MTVTSLPAHVAVAAPPSADFALPITFTSNGAQTDKSASTFAATVRANEDASTATLTFTIDTTNAVTGTIVVRATDAAMALATGEYWWRLTEAVAGVDSVPLAGPFTVTRGARPGAVPSGGSVTVDQVTQTVTVNSSLVAGTIALTKEVLGAVGATETIAFVPRGRKYVTLTLDANLTVTLSGLVSGYPSELVLRLLQDGTGGRTLTLPAGVLTSNNNPIVLSTGAAQVDYLTLFSVDGVEVVAVMNAVNVS